MYGLGEVAAIRLALLLFGYSEEWKTIHRWEYAKIFMLDVANEIFEYFSNKDKIIKRTTFASVSKNSSRSH